MDKRFLVNRQGKDFVLYAGLLDQAHREGLKRITTKLLQAPLDENGHLAICYAEVETEKGVFSGVGDASPENVGRMIAMHTVRIAETRAKARALRDAVNVGVTALEELGDDAPEPVVTRPAPRPVPAVAAAQTSRETLVACDDWIAEHTGGIRLGVPADLPEAEYAGRLAWMKARYATYTDKSKPATPEQRTRLEDYRTRFKLWEGALPPLSQDGAAALIGQWALQITAQQKKAAAS